MPESVSGLLELDDIQSGVLRPRPSPYVATYLLLRIDDRKAGRELMRRLSNVVASAAHRESPAADTWVSASLTFQGLKALGVPQESLDSFAWEFQQGMVARARHLGDTGDSSPEHWEAPLGAPDVHVVITALSPDANGLEAALERAREAIQALPGVALIWRQDCYALPGPTEHFGFRDGMSHPAIEGSGIPGTNPAQRPYKAGEFVLGYPDELGGTLTPQPEALGRNGTYVAFRKLYQRVALFRRYVKENSLGPADEELLAAKMMGRWRSGAPLALCPSSDNPELGGDPLRNNAFLYGDDPTGFKTPLEAHIRRVNPRDSSVAGIVGLHRMIRRGTVYGPPLAEGVLEDDGVDRGFIFAFVGAHPGRQFEFVQTEWVNSGVFIGAGNAKDPITGSNEGDGDFTIPRRPIPRRLHGLPRFVVTRGGEYAFMPGLRALRWLADLQT
ncbi:Dyp-type peroxidase [Sorangium sp. So ce291]|uniref:Dyp-type peroxidase n=1 Tax=Sorangium sp. So ce291 TaxID=3133294 RepID=UPI003F5DDD73